VGGALYLCGSASTLAKSVTTALLQILGGEKDDGQSALNALREEGRLVFDVWG
jgi:sulfite reductase alpha subunit-like flavoprotein